MPIVSTSSRGQLVIPKEVRKRLKLLPGQKLLIKIEGDHAVLRPLPDNPVDYYCGFFAGDTSLTEALMEERKKDGEREAEKAAG